jgi:hypothetical protein
MKRMDDRIPQFRSEDDEREFWATHSPLDYFDSRTPKRAPLPDLKPSLKSISIRVPSDMLAELISGVDAKLVTQQLPSKVCSPDHERFTDPIDHILITGNLLSGFSGTVRMEDVFEDPSIPREESDRFSDHCPVWAEFRI